MPITIKSSRMQYRKSNGDYVGVDAVSERKTAEYVSDIESTGSATQSAIEQTASTARDAIDTKAQQARDSIPSDYTALSDEVNDLKSAINEPLLYEITKPDGLIVQGFYAFSSGTEASDASNYLHSAGCINDFKRVKIDSSYGIGICLQAYSNGTYIGTWNLTNQRWEITSYNSAFMGYDFDIAAFRNNYPSYDFVVTLRRLTGDTITPADLDGKIVFVKNQEATAINDIFNAIGDFGYYEVNLPPMRTTVGQWWNIRIIKTVSAGTKFKVKLLEYTGALFTSFTVGYINASNSYITIKGGLAIGQEYEIAAPVDITKLYIQIVRSNNEYNVSAKFLLSFFEQSGSVYTCLKDGNGDFASLVSAVNAAVNRQNSIVYVGSGTWDVLSELGSTYLNAVSSDSSTWGMVLKNNIHLIFSSNSEVVAEYTGSNANVRKYLSVFNSGEGGFILENCKIRSKNIRYCVHDDRGSMVTPYHNKYINCDMYHDNSANTDFGGWQCIGGGFGVAGDIDIEGCTFNGHNQWGDFGGIVSYHNSASASAKSKLTIRDCYFVGSYTVRVSWYGTSTEITKAYITGCRLGQAIVHQAETESSTVQNTEVIAWNNEIASA